MSTAGSSTFKVAAIQAAPVFLNLEASVDRACELIAEAGQNGAKLAVFPEAFLPCYPLWTWFIPTARTKELRVLYPCPLFGAVEQLGGNPWTGGRAPV